MNDTTTTMSDTDIIKRMNTVTAIAELALKRKDWASVAECQAELAALADLYNSKN